MKTCLVSLLLIPTILALVGSVVYHTSVNSELRFEERDTNAEYINIRRSYRPQPKEDKEDTKVPAGLKNDDTPEEVAA